MFLGMILEPLLGAVDRKAVREWLLTPLRCVTMQKNALRACSTSNAMETDASLRN